MPLPDKDTRNPEFAAYAILMALGLTPAEIKAHRAAFEARSDADNVSHVMIEAMRADHAARLGDDEQVESTLIETITLGALCLLDLVEAREAAGADA